MRLKLKCVFVNESQQHYNDELVDLESTVFCCDKMKECLPPNQKDDEDEENLFKLLNSGLTIHSSKLDNYENQIYRQYTPIQFCPFCGVKIELEVVKKVVRKTKFVDRQQTIRDRINFEEEIQ